MDWNWSYGCKVGRDAACCMDKIRQDRFECRIEVDLSQVEGVLIMA